MVADPRSPNGGSRPVPDPTVLTQDAIDALRREIETLRNVQLVAAEKLTAQQLEAFGSRLDKMEDLRLEQKADTSKAVDAALAAAKEAVGKTETTFTEALKGQRDTFGTAIAAQDSRYNDMKERLTRIETSKATTGTTLAGIASAILLLIAVLGFFAVRDNNPAPADPVIVQVPVAETP